MGHLVISSKRINSIQYLRAVAALAVVVYHATNIMNPTSKFANLFSGGAHGVDLFFVISGLVMYMTTDAESSALKFMERRLVRLVPLYWIVTAITSLAAIIVPSAFKTAKPDLVRFIKSILFIPHYHAVERNHIWPIAVQGWTLNYEMFFYTILAVSLATISRAPFICASIILVLLVFSGSIFHPHSAVLATYTSPLLLEFLSGVFIGWVYRFSGGKELMLLSTLLIITGCAAFLIPVSAIEWRTAYVGCFAAAVVAGVLYLEKRRGIISWAPAIALGDASYSLYLSHLFVLGTFRLMIRRSGSIIENPFVDLFSILIATITAASVSILVFQYIERPITKGLRNMVGVQPLWQRWMFRRSLAKRSD